MSVISVLAIYFIAWWFILFLVLPFFTKTQSGNGDVVLGTVKSAPPRFQALKIFGTTSIITALFLLVYYVMTDVLGLSISDIPLDKLVFG